MTGNYKDYKDESHLVATLSKLCKPSFHKTNKLNKRKTMNWKINRTGKGTNNLFRVSQGF